MSKYDIDVGESTAAKAVQKAEDIKTALTTRASQSIDGILLAVVCALEVLLVFVSISYSSSFSLMDAVCTFSESAVTIVVFYMFIKPGKNGRIGMNAFQTAYKEWKKLCSNLRDNGLLGAFRAHCEARTKADREKLKDTQIEHLENLFVTREKYDGTDGERGYCAMSKRELKRLRKQGVFSKAAYKQILKCKKPVETAPYNPDLILDGSNDKDVQKGLKTGDHYETIGVILKPVTCFIITVASKLMEFSRNGIQDPLAVVTSVLVTLLSICLAAFFGYRFGWNCIAREQGYIEARCGFIRQFNEKHPSSE